MKAKDELLVHIRKIKHGVVQPNEGITIYAKRDKVTHDYFWVTVAQCGKRDIFNKKIARAIVEGRMVCTRTKKTMMNKEVLKNMLLSNDEKYAKGAHQGLFTKLLSRV